MSFFRLTLACLFLISPLAAQGNPPAAASSPVQEENPLEGLWIYYKKIFRGVEMPEPPSATLRLNFEFRPDGTSLLYWWHEGENDWCERAGRYSLENGILTDEVVWVNPENTRECSRDPDMQQGRITRTPVSFVNGDFLLHLHLGDDPLVYVWKRAEAIGSPDSGEKKDETHSATGRPLPSRSRR